MRSGRSFREHSARPRAGCACLSALTTAQASQAAWCAVYAREDGARLRNLGLSAELETGRARVDLAEVMESARAVEGIVLSGGEVKALAVGITAGGDPLNIRRASEIALRSLGSRM